MAESDQAKTGLAGLLAIALPTMICRRHGILSHKRPFGIPFLNPSWHTPSKNTCRVLIRSHGKLLC